MYSMGLSINPLIVVMSYVVCMKRRMTTLYVMMKGTIYECFSQRESPRATSLSVHTHKEPLVSYVTWSPGPACGAQAACKLYTSLLSVFFDGR